MNKLSRLIIVGECFLGLNEYDNHSSWVDAAASEENSRRNMRNSSLLNTANPANFVKSPQTSSFVMVLNCDNREQQQYTNQGPTDRHYLSQSSMGPQTSLEPTPLLIKVLRLPPMPDPLKSNRITSLAFGPYDNGYVLLGTLSGHLLCLESISLRRAII